MCGRLVVGVRRCLGSVAPLIALLVSGTLSACATIPKHEYGVNSLTVSGMQQLDEVALKACLATQARERIGVAGDAECGVPPFDSQRLGIELWAWPWTEWPTYDETVWNRDVLRVARWYKARGYYAARVTKVSQTPNDADHEIDLALTVEENEPVLVESIELHGLETLDQRTKREVERAVQLRKGEPFDEAIYDESKRAIADALREHAYALADATGSVRVDPEHRKAAVSFTLMPGNRYRFGKISVEGQGTLPVAPIFGAAEIDEGAPFSVSAIDDAKRAIYELGPFASVEVIEQPHKETGRVDILIKVVPGRRLRTAIGAGLQVGTDPTLTPTDAPSDSLDLWDVHLLGRIEHRNFLGGMRRISIEDRPRVLFDKSFPDAASPHLGNLLILDFKQPAFIEPRTTFGITTRWDRGRDPYTYVLRSDLLGGMGPERTFFNGQLRISATINLNLFLPDEPNNQISTVGHIHYPKYYATYMQYAFVLDLRDQPREPRRGTYFSLNVQHAGYFLPSDWDYIRVIPDARAYYPLPYGMVLAGRVRLGYMEITDSRIPVDKATDTLGIQQRLRDLGPLRQRLRGGGNNSVRGYDPNTLGDINAIGNIVDSGGLRQWEASIELRAPLIADFGAVLFVDVGDVTAQKVFRFEDLQTSFGIGLRYRTIIGPVRLDFGFAPGPLQTIGSDTRTRCSLDDSGTCHPFPESRLLGTRGALHFTIGEAY